MDTSKMCEKAEEIQANYIPKLGDCVSVKWKQDSNSGGLTGSILQDRPCYGLGYEFYYLKTNKKQNWYIYNGFISGEQFKVRLFDNDNAEAVVYLPCQDQLQEIYSSRWVKFDNACLLAAQEYMNRNELYGYICCHVSKEQAGLMVVMKEKYKKTWDGKEWVK